MASWSAHRIVGVVSTAAYGLDPVQMLRSIDASRDTLGLVPMKLIEVVREVQALTEGAPYAVLGGLAQILWARKTHTDDLDMLLAGRELAHAVARVESGHVPGWTLPVPPDRAHESNDIFEVYRLLFDRSVVDLLSIAHQAFNAEILATAMPVPELGDIRFIRPELLLVTQLLRPGALGAIAALELTLARRAAGGFDAAYAARWAGELGRTEALRRTLTRADEIERE